MAAGVLVLRVGAPRPSTMGNMNGSVMELPDFILEYIYICIYIYIDILYLFCMYIRALLWSLVFGGAPLRNLEVGL